MNYAFQLPQRCFIFKNQLCNLLPVQLPVNCQVISAKNIYNLLQELKRTGNYEVESLPVEEEVDANAPANR